jgi:DNA-binding GntR family transcriptional regulator
MNAITQLQPTHLKDAVYDRIYAAINAGVIPAGARINEAQLAESLGISRGPVREALIRLEYEGLVERRANRGAYVAEVRSATDAEEISTVLIGLEVLALRLAAERMTEEDHLRLGEIAAALSEAAHAGDLATVSALDDELHEAIRLLAQNKRLYQLVKLIDREWTPIYLTALRQSPDDLLEMAANHQRMLAALRAGDLDLAADRLRRHYLTRTERVFDILPEAADEEEG